MAEVAVMTGFLFVSLIFAADFDALAFMTGAWRSGDAKGDSVEETWLAPKQNLMVGMNRTVNGRNAAFDFMRIEHRKEGTVYVAQPQGSPPTEFKLTQSTVKTATFENLSHDFPQRIRYWLDEAGKLHARIEDASGKKGMDWTWERAP